MDIGRYVAQLREDLTSAAAAGDEQTRRTAALLGAAVEPAARLAVMNALADLAAEITAELGDRTVEVRLDGRDVRVAVGPEHVADATPPPPPPRGPGVDTGDISRITLRLVVKNRFFTSCCVMVDPPRPRRPSSRSWSTTFWTSFQSTP